MRVAIVRHGDPTTTGGMVIALSSTIFDDGKNIALSGDQATCGTCKGRWKIAGTATTMGENGRNAVVQGDRVLCPCGKNRVIPGPGASMFISDYGEPVRAPVHTGDGEKVLARQNRYDEQYTLKDSTGHPLAGMRYRIVADSGRVITGTTDASGRTERVVTQGLSRLRLQLEK